MEDNRIWVMCSGKLNNWMRAVTAEGRSGQYRRRRRDEGQTAPKCLIKLQ